jgi:hypothetical protein
MRQDVFGRQFPDNNPGSTPPRHGDIDHHAEQQEHAEFEQQLLRGAGAFHDDALVLHAAGKGAPHSLHTGPMPPPGTIWYPHAGQR